MGRFSKEGLADRKALASAIVSPIVRGLRDRKVAGTYNRFTPDPTTGRIHTALAPDTASFRLSSGETPLYVSTNAQNMENKVAKLDPLYQVRDIIEAPEGWEFVCCDYAGAEAVLVAAYSRDWRYLEKLLSGFDTHSEHAAYFWGNLFTVLDAKDPSRKLFRDVAKTITYASFYYAKVPTITQNLNKEADRLGRYFTQNEVAELRNKFLQLHTLEAWWAESRAFLDQSGGVGRNCFDYRRTFYAPDEDSRLKDYLSFLPQSTVAYLMNDNLPRIYAEVDNEVSRQVLHQVHDELVFLARIGEHEFIARTVTPILERRFRINDRELYIPLDWKKGPIWGQQSSFKLKLVA